MDELCSLVQRPPSARHLDPLRPCDHDEPELDEDLQPPAHDRLRDPKRRAHRLLGELRACNCLTFTLIFILCKLTMKKND